MGAKDSKPAFVTFEDAGKRGMGEKYSEPGFMFWTQILCWMREDLVWPKLVSGIFLKSSVFPQDDLNCGQLVLSNGQGARRL